MADTPLMKQYKEIKSNFEDIDISQIIVAKNRKVKDFNMMMSENPIYVISARK